MRRPPSPVILFAAAAFATGCGGGGAASTSSVALPAGCQSVPQPPPKHVNLKAPPAGRVTGGKPTAVVSTSCGSFTIALDVRDSPKTVNSFVYMAEKGVYDDTTFHRVVPGFVIQGGDPEGTGTGGPGYSITEKPPPRTEYTKGVVAMAKTQVEPPGTSGSQFFVVVAADAGLPPAYAVLGKVTSGQSTIDRIVQLGNPRAADPTASPSTQTPLAPIVIKSVTVRGA